MAGHDRESQFPERLAGVWRRGSLRPDDMLPEPDVARARGRSRRASAEPTRADEPAPARPRRAGADAVHAAATDTAHRAAESGPPTLDEIEQQLRSAGRDMLERLQQRRGAGGSRTPSTPSTAGPRRRRSFVGWLLHKAIVFAVLYVIVTRVFDVDLEPFWRAVEQQGASLLGEAPESAPTSAGEPAGAVEQQAPAQPPRHLRPVSPVANGGFETPPLGGDGDSVVPAGWRLSGDRSFPRVDAERAGFPAAADGRVVVTLEGGSERFLYQDLGLMQAGRTYVFRATVSNASGRNAYRAAFHRVDEHGAGEVAYISERQVDPPRGDGFPVSFAYTAGADDDGRLLRLVLSANGGPPGTRTAIDAVTVRTE